MDLTTPQSQKAGDKPITFVVDDRSGNTHDEMTLLIRPEELSIGFPSRLTVNQTLGGGWADSFGVGLEEGTFAGTTGWRATSDDSGGTERMIKLKRMVLDDWHNKRAAAIARGDDPIKVKLFLLDNLNDLWREIAPRQFELKRSKSRPLLSQYRFSFVTLSRDMTGAVLPAAIGGDSTFLGSILGKVGSWIDSFNASINAITAKIKQVYQWVDKNIVAPVKAFVAKTQALLTTVRNAVSAGMGVIRQLGSVVSLATKAVSNVLSAASLVIGLPNTAKATIMGVVREFTNLTCLVKNARRALTYEDYSDIYGASNCSSTAGGKSVSIYSGKNTFQAISTTASSGYRLTQQAASSLTALANTDLVTTALPASSIASHLTAINNGLAVA